MSEPKVCLFCRRAGHSKITNEHVWPQWMGRVLGEPAQVKTVTLDYTAEHLRHWNEKGPTALKVNTVCAECNNGWMSELERHVEPILAPMMLRTDPVILSRKENGALWHWGVKTAMVVDATKPDSHKVFAAPEFRSFWASRRVPGLRIYVSLACLDPRSRLQFVMSSASLMVGMKQSFELRRALIDSVVLAAGHLAMEVMIFRIEGNPDGTAVFREEDGWKTKIVRLEPRDSVQWPPPERLDDAGYMQLATRYSRAVQYQRDPEGEPQRRQDLLDKIDRMFARERERRQQRERKE